MGPSTNYFRPDYRLLLSKSWTRRRYSTKNKQIRPGVMRALGRAQKFSALAKTFPAFYKHDDEIRDGGYGCGAKKIVFKLFVLLAGKEEGV